MLDIFSLEKNRKNISLKIARIRLGCAIIGVIGLLIIFNINCSNFMPFVYGLIFGLISLDIWLEKRLSKDFLDNTKSEYIANLLEKLNKGDLKIEFNRQNFIPQNSFFINGLYPPKCDEYTGNDLFVGKKGDIDFMFSDIFVRVISHFEKGKYSIKNGEIVNTKVLFGGTLFIAGIKRDISGTLYACAKYNPYLKPRGKRQVMDNVLFEKYFTTYSDDAINARYILNPRVMEKIVAFRQMLDCSVSVVFFAKKVYFYVDNRTDNFEVQIGKDIRANFKKIKTEIEKFLAIVEEINK